MGIYEELGVTAYINANEWYTSQGGSMLPTPVIQAMAEAPQRAAVKHFLNGGAETTQRMASDIAGELVDTPGVAIRVDEAASHVHLRLSPSRFRITPDQIRQRSLEEEPRVLVRPSGPREIRVNAGTLAEGQEQLVARRLKELLLGAVE